MRKVKQEGNGKKPLSTYIMVAAVAIVTLWLVYFVNIELLPFLFGLDGEAYRQALINLAAQMLTTAVGVFLGMLGFYAVFQPQKLTGQSQPDPAQEAQGGHCKETDER